MSNQQNQPVLPYNSQLESRLWENDASYIIAVAPRVFENDRIRLKIILGYKVQSLVHGLPDPVEQQYANYGFYDGTSLNFGSNDGSMLPNSRRRRNYYQYFNRNSLYDQLSPEQFNALPESQQRQILRDRYLHNQFQQQQSQQSPTFNSGSNWNQFSYWMLQNWDHFGWRSTLGVATFIFGLLRTIRSFYK